MRILITNDDGVLAPGIAVLAREVARWIERCPQGEEREAIIVAPYQNYSGMSSASATSSTTRRSSTSATLLAAPRPYLPTRLRRHRHCA